MRSLLVLILLLAALVPASSALAQGVVAPPGNSGVQQYLPAIPSAGGDAPASSAKQRHKLPTDVQNRLDSRGADGRKLAEILATTPAAPVKQDAAVKHPAAKNGRPTSRVHSAVSALAGGDTSDGMGLALPLLLISTVVVLGGIALRRRRA
jgi:hypothetical protein